MPKWNQRSDFGMKQTKAVHKNDAYKTQSHRYMIRYNIPTWKQQLWK